MLALEKGFIVSHMCKDLLITPKHHNRVKLFLCLVCSRITRVGTPNSQKNDKNV